MKDSSKILIVMFMTCFCGCSTIKPQTTLSGLEWKMPTAPSKYHVEFKKEDNQIVLTKENAYNLLRNIDENEIYVKKLETLITEMKKYYNAK
jgi:hypothetical protein